MPAVLDENAIPSWVDDFGSSRLRKAKLKGYLKESLGVYRSERLKLERPEWKFLRIEHLTHSQLTETLKKISNPSEDALDALIDADERYGEEKNPVVLRHWFDKEVGKSIEILVQPFLGRTAGIDVVDYLKWLNPDYQSETGD